jgi:hypothetical protein
MEEVTVSSKNQIVVPRKAGSFASRPAPGCTSSVAIPP